MFVDVVNAFKLGSYVDGPAKRAHIDFQFRFEFVEDIERVATFAVELIDENYHRSVAHAAHFHEFASLLLHTFSHVDHDYNAIYSSESAVGVLGEVLVTRGVEDIDFVVAVIKTHHRSSHGDAALLFDFHPVGGGCFAYFVRFHGTSHVNGATEEEEFFGKGGLTGIGVRDNGECASLGYFAC